MLELCLYKTNKARLLLQETKPKLLYLPAVMQLVLSSLHLLCMTRNVWNQNVWGSGPGTMYGMSESSWINRKLFDLWFLHHFLPYGPFCPTTTSSFGRSFITLHSFCNKKSRRKSYSFLSPSSLIPRTQQLDKGPFGPLKSSWKDVCHRKIQVKW